MFGQSLKQLYFYIYSAKDLDDAARKAVGALWLDKEIFDLQITTEDIAFKNLM